jgi:phage terminase large subunit-like protein
MLNRANQRYEKIVDWKDDHHEERELCEGSLYEFIKRAFPVLEGRHTFKEGWHIEAISEHLEACYNGEVRSLVINIPPGFMKTYICSIMFPAWCWTKDPSLKFFCLSYGQFLALKDSSDCRRLIQSDWFQKLWGNRFSMRGDSNSKTMFANDKGGYRIASSIGGPTTGLRGHFVICDDPNNVMDMNSDVTRETTNSWWDAAVTTRMNDFSRYCRIVIQQRLHQRDLTGHLLGQKDSSLVHLRLPMEYEKGSRCVTIPLKSTEGKKWKDPRTKEGELLWPSYLTREIVDGLKSKLNSEYTISGQFQQRPSPSEGGIIKKGWFNWWCQDELPACEFILQSWDTAFTRPSTKRQAANVSYSACTTWGVFYNEFNVPNIILLSLFRGRIEYPELRDMAQRLARNYYDNDIDNPMSTSYKLAPNTILVEAKASGLALIADLHRAGAMVTRFDPNKYGDKLTRARLATPLIESGRVWMPAKAPHFTKLEPFADLFVESAISFPNMESNDLIDTMSQAFIRINSGGWVQHPLDPEPIQMNHWRDHDKPLYDGR